MTIPDGVEAAKVTVAVGTGVATVKPNGANVKIVKSGYDITAFLDVPEAVNGFIAVGNATVKEAIVKEALDPSKGAVINLGNPASPSLTTPATRPGLTYTLREGTSLQGLKDGATKQGDGQPWTPPITVKGGTSGFYTIKVEK